MVSQSFGTEGLEPTLLLHHLSSTKQKVCKQ
jgi:hypothetical protein